MSDSEAGPGWDELGEDDPFASEHQPSASHQLSAEGWETYQKGWMRQLTRLPIDLC